jgi:predicted MFS family arabinose efflux permease
MSRAVALFRKPSGGALLAPGAIYAALLLTLINIFNYMDRMIFAVLVQPIKQELGLSDTQIGLLSGFAFVALYAAFSLPLARWADRHGRRWVLAGSVAVWSLMSAACGAAHSFTQMAVTRIGVGMGEAGCMPSSHALLAELYPPGRRALPIAIVTAGAAIGIAAGLSAGGLIAQHYGWRIAFVIVGLPGVLLALLVGVSLPDPIRKRPIDTDPGIRATVRELYKIRTYRWITLTHPFYQFSSAGILAWLPAFFMRSHGMTVASAGLFFGVMYGFGVGAGLCIGAYVLQRITPRTSGRGLHLAGRLVLLAFPFYLGALLFAPIWVSLTCMMIFGALIGGAGGPMIAAQQGVVDSTTRGVASALSLFIASYVGGGLGPLLVGAGSEMLSPAYGAEALRTVLLIASSAVLIAGLCLMQASRSFEADLKD